MKFKKLKILDKLKMSNLHYQFNNMVVKTIEDSIHKYATLISSKYNLDVTEIKNIWYNIDDTEKEDTEKEDTEKEDTETLKLMKASSAELKALCKKKGFKVSGTKAELIYRLLHNGENKAKQTKNNKKIIKKTPPVINKLSDNISTIQIRRNSFGNFEHSETKFIFNKDTQQVIGKQTDDGTISDLEKKDIELCNKFKFKYIILKFKQNADNDNIKIEEIN